MTFRNPKGSANAGPRNFGDVAREFSRRRVPPLDYRYDELVDGRALRPGEKELVLDMLRGGDAEGRCAAAYICLRLGIAEAKAVMRGALAAGVESEHVKCSFEFCSMCLAMAEEHGTGPKPAEQLMILLKLRNSGDNVEMRFAKLVLERADIKYGTLTSW